jgi:hypothetical protein
MRAIFISYRRDDTEGHAGRLFEDLCERFGKNSVFMDVAGIEPGRDFRRVIEQQVSSCGVLLAVIGKNWLTVVDQQGRRRLDDPYDFVRLETASALKRDIPVIPVLVHDAGMPRAEQLPDDLKELAFRNSVELNHARWSSDVQLLIQALMPHVDVERVDPTVRFPRWAVASIAALVAGGVGYAAWDRFAPAPPPGGPRPVAAPGSSASAAPLAAASAGPGASEPASAALQARAASTPPAVASAAAIVVAAAPSPPPASRAAPVPPAASRAPAPKPPAPRPSPPPPSPAPAPEPATRPAAGESGYGPAPAPSPVPIAASPRPAPAPPAAAPPSGPQVLAARSDPSLELFGSPAPVSLVTRTIAIGPGTSYVNVTGGEVIRFDVGDKSFVWNFNGQRSSFDLAKVAPPGLLARKVTAYVAPNPMQPRRS